MQSIALQPIAEEPADLLIYPDYLVSSLLREGIGKIEADLSLQQDGMVEFVLTSRSTAASRVAVRLRPAPFRTVLARFGAICSVSNLYSSHTLFACDYEREGLLRSHRFGLFICNEPAMAIWLRLYLFCIDGSWPLKKDAT